MTYTDDIIYKKAGVAIRAARQGRRLTQAELARRMGVTNSYISNLEAGRQTLTLNQLGKIADTMGAVVNFDLNFDIIDAST